MEKPKLSLREEKQYGNIAFVDEGFSFRLGSKELMRIERDGTVKVFTEGEGKASPKVYYALLQCFCPEDVPSFPFQEWGHAKRLLKSLEWVNADVMFGRLCPCCRRSQFKKGMPNSHTKNCELAILIGAQRE